MLRGSLYEPFAVGENISVKVLMGQFEGTIINFTDFSLSPDAPNGLNVEYSLVPATEGMIDDESDALLFEELFSTIVTDIIEEATQLYEQRDRTENI